MAKMNQWILFTFMLIFCCLIQPTLSSYLGYPRLHFAGRFFAQPNIVNNDLCAYLPGMYPIVEHLKNDRMNIVHGTNEFSFYDSKITSVVYEDGTLSTTDPVVGHHIIDNLKRPLAKMVEHSLNSHTTIYGMKFGIKWTQDDPREKDDFVFYGKYSRSVLAQLMWKRLKCYSEKKHGPLPHQADLDIGVQSTSTVTDIEWGNLGQSYALRQLRHAVGDGNLSVRVSLFYHSSQGYNNSLGYVVGAIGVPSPSDSLGIPGQRAMFAKDFPVLTFDSEDLCYNEAMSDYNDWFQMAPFEVDEVRSEIRLDLSNSLPTDIYNSVRDLGTLRLGILLSSHSCVYLLGDEKGLPYASNDDFPVTSAIYTVPVDPSLMEMLTSNPVVLVQALLEGEGTNVSCNGRGEPDIHIIMQELTYFIRPKGLYFEFLDRKYNPTSVQTVYVTKYGFPLERVQLKALPSDDRRKPRPVDGVLPISSSVITDENGLATFEFKINEEIEIPTERHNMHLPCNHSLGSQPPVDTPLPIDSQVYWFYYCLDVEGVDCDNYVFTSLLVFADVSYNRPYTWVRDVEPIFEQYSRVAPMMKKVIDLSDYNAVTLPHNLNLLKHTLRVDVNEPSHMPTTRDLSPTKREMILEWLDDPIYDLADTKSAPLREMCLSCDVNVSTFLKSAHHFLPLRCKLSLLRFDTAPHHDEPYFNRILLQSSDMAQSQVALRPLFYSTSGCSVGNLKQQLQTAIQLEFLTLPVYLTSLYSIKDGYNAEIAFIIRSIIVQEMLHMTQAANILIAMNGSPIINDASIIPSFPLTGLPGGVLPNLEVSLEKLSLEHVYKVFMGIEVPQSTFVGSPIVSNKTTIGAFYEEIKDCIDVLGDDIFDVSSLDRQVKWPWVPNRDVGTIVPVTDSDSAQRAIEIIVSQGEGASVLNPDQIGSDTLAHFFKFEEIVCQRRLEQVDNFNYAYVGAPIPFSSEGVWPMRPNPKASTIPPHSSCYHLSRVFHHIFRNFLRKLQEVFNGRPEDLYVSVQLMKSLQVHAKKLMWTHVDSDTGNTCGPVWDYTWPEDIE